AWRERTADEILDDFLAPFHEGPPSEDIVHLLAINDGRLLEWIEGFEGRHGGHETVLTAELYELLETETTAQESHIRFISLNQRSLVGGITENREIKATFLGRLMDQLYGGKRAAEIWSPCQTCSAKDRCEVFNAARLFGPDSLATLAPPSVRSRVRQRLFEA